jgi:hypothetical protein
MSRTLVAVIGILSLAGGAILLAGCDSPAAQRARAEAALTLAQAEAYQQRQQADTQAASERASLRQMERDAAHQRTLEMLPFVLLIGGGIFLAGLGGLIFWDSRSQPAPAADPRLLAYLEELQIQQAERDRLLWRALAGLHRQQSLPAGSSEVAIYDSKGRRDR